MFKTSKFLTVQESLVPTSTAEEEYIRKRPGIKYLRILLSGERARCCEAARVTDQDVEKRFAFPLSVLFHSVQSFGLSARLEALFCLPLELVEKRKETGLRVYLLDPAGRLKDTSLPV